MCRILHAGTPIIHIGITAAITGIARDKKKLAFYFPIYPRLIRFDCNCSFTLVLEDYRFIWILWKRIHVSYYGLGIGGVGA